MHVAPAPKDFADWDGLLSLILDSFAYMQGRIDPPSSARHLTAAALAQRADAEHLWLAGPSLAGCAFFAERSDALYIGKLAIRPDMQGAGLGRTFVKAAEDLARTIGLPRLRLETRIELTDNHAAFARLGFEKVAEKAHPGFDRPTSITMEKPVIAAVNEGTI